MAKFQWLTMTWKKREEETDEEKEGGQKIRMREGNKEEERKNGLGSRGDLIAGMEHF